jgi:hypothetical protein
MQTLHPPTAVRGGQVRAGNAAWLLDVHAFHREVDDLFARLSTSDGPAPMRERATELWESDDPVVHDYVSRLETDTPDDWAVTFDQRHLGQWYRVLMAGHLEPTRSLRAPQVVRTRLPALGFSPAYARRLALGREVVELAETCASPAVAAAIGLVLGPGHKGWLSHDDVTFALDRLRAVDRRAFRQAQDLVPVCEDLWASLAAAADHADSALVVLAAGA